jgi:hypothetical protein
MIMRRIGRSGSHEAAAATAVRLGGAAALALPPAEAVAHAFGTRYDLPLPLHLWLAAAGLAVALSFVVFALALRPRAGYARFFLLRLHPLVVAALRAASLGVLVVLIAAGLFGTQDPFRNLAPAFVWIAWWLGFTYLCAVLGDLWALANPWKVLSPKGLFELPPAVGAWPAVVMLLAFAWTEIVWEGNAVPANLAWLALGYSLLTWAGMFAFGRDAWLQSAEVFTVYFGFIARLAPLEWRAGRELHLRAPGAGLLDAQPLSASQAFFVIVMLTIVTFDGLRETPLWAVGDAHWTAAATAGLLAIPLIFAVVIFGVCALMGNASPGELLRLFVPTLLPIALAYHVAHYLSYLLVAGQVVIPLASDPLGRGWDLFGTAHYQIAVGIVGARFAWYASVIAIVAGHVFAMYAGHRLALARFSERRSARRSQYPLAALMVAYTMLSLWILAQPIVETVK